MKSRINRNLLRWSIILIGSAMVIFTIGVSFSIYVENKIEEKILSANGEISSVNVNLLTRSISIKDFKWASATDSLNPTQHSLSLSSISVSGIRLFELLIYKTLHVTDVVVADGKIEFNKKIKQSDQRITNPKLRYFFFENISFNNIETQIKTDTLVDFSSVLNCQLTAARIKIDSINNLNYSVKAIDALLKKINVSRQEGMYGGTIARLYINTDEKKVIMDSALLIPNFTKFEFGQHLGTQTARINISIPQLAIEGVQFEKIMDSLFVASKIEISSFSLYAFKDKRIPFLRKKNVPLPMESFLKLPLAIKIDTITIKDSNIMIEELPEEGSESGVITFDKVNATLTGLNNRVKENDPAFALLDVTALLMGTGIIKVLFQLPLDGSLIYNAKGSISKMPFTKLDHVLTTMAKVRVNSGYLNNLTFNFNYTEFTSKGNLDIDYHDLQLTGLDKNKKSTNEIKTFIINAFVNNSKTQSGLATSKKTGVINIERDRKRYIFNVWLKSILDGLKSSILGKK